MKRNKNRDKGKFKYQRRSKEDVRAAANQRGGNFDSIIKDGIKMYKVREGKNVIRILPPTWENARHYAYTLMVHYGIGVDNQSYLSLKHMLNKKDPLDEARREAQREGDEKLSKALEAKKRSGVWLIDRLDEEAGPQFLGMPFTLDKDISQMCYDEDSNEAILVDDPEDGCDIRFYREGTGRNTKYPAAKMKIMKTSPLSEDDDQRKEWLDYITENPIPDVLQYHDYEHISDVFGGKAGRDDDDDDDDKKRNKRGKRRDDDDDEDEKPSKKSSAKKRSRDDDDDDDDDDEKPAKKTKGKSSKKGDDDEDEDDDDDTDDDDDDDDDDSDDDDDDDDDRKSSKRGKASNRRGRDRDTDDDDDDSDDDDDDEDDDDEDDRKSSKKSSTKSRADRIKDRLNKAKAKRKRD